MKDPKEQDIQKVIIDYLRLKKFVVMKHRNVGIYKQKTGRYIPIPNTEKGISDIIACSTEGRFIAVEVKRKGGKPSPDQIEFLEKIKERGGIAILAYGLDDVIPIIDKLSESNVPVGDIQNIKLAA